LHFSRFCGKNALVVLLLPKLFFRLFYILFLKESLKNKYNVLWPKILEILSMAGALVVGIFLAGAIAVAFASHIAIAHADSTSTSTSLDSITITSQADASSTNGSASASSTATVIGAGTASTTASATSTATTSTALATATASSGTGTSTTPVCTSTILAVTKTVDNANPFEGNTIHYTVTVSNNGTIDATNVAVKDQWPAGLTFVSSTSSQGSYDPLMGSWNVGTLTPGKTVTLTITATVKVGTQGLTIINKVTALSDQSNPATAQVSVLVLCNPAQSTSTAEIGIAKTVDSANPHEGRYNPLHFDGDGLRAIVFDRRSGIGHPACGRHVRIGDIIER
jgi:uncharacterized repeat protein (TIGR01451 family)